MCADVQVILLPSLNSAIAIASGLLPPVKPGGSSPLTRDIHSLFFLPTRKSYNSVVVCQDNFDDYRAMNVGNMQGRGLGLAIVKKCVHTHQSEIAVTSKIGVGTTFTVTLPMSTSYNQQSTINN